jgi:hypothetical protein
MLVRHLVIDAVNPTFHNPEEILNSACRYASAYSFVPATVY